MGVQGLWPLLEPVGRRVKIEALANKTLAVDASVWLFQFIKAMRDERGELIKNAHLLGFFRRICRLLFHKIRPVFVFDGATPALKQRTTIARRRRREQQDAKLRKTAEKLLLNQLKQHALGQLQEAQLKAARAGKGPAEAVTWAAGTGKGRGRGGLLATARELGHATGHRVGRTTKQKKLETVEEGEDVERLPHVQQRRQQQQDEEAKHGAGATTAAVGSGQQAARFWDDDQPGTSKSHAAAAAAASAAAAAFGSGAGPSKEMLDDLLAAQLAAEEWEDAELEQPAQQKQQAQRAAVAVGGGGGELAVHGMELGGDEAEEEEDNEDIAAGLEMLVPEDGELDPEVLSTLPPSLQLEIMMRARDQRMVVNREQFEQRSGVPASFSEFQLQQYLQASALRRQVEQVRTAVNDAAAGGEAGRRIAAEAGREYVLHKDPQPGGGAAAAPARAAAAAWGGGPDAGAGEEDSVEISLELPLEDSPGGGGGASESDLEWEDVEPSPSVLGGKADTIDPSKLHWRERAARRQKYWSLSHGFQMGRALADWGKEPDSREGPGQGVHPFELTEEDAEFQRAIQLSLQEQGGAAGAPEARPQEEVEISEEEMGWEDVSEQVEREEMAHPGSPGQVVVTQEGVGADVEGGEDGMEVWEDITALPSQEPQKEPQQQQPPVIPSHSPGTSPWQGQQQQQQQQQPEQQHEGEESILVVREPQALPALASAAGAQAGPALAAGAPSVQQVPQIAELQAAATLLASGVVAAAVPFPPKQLVAPESDPGAAPSAPNHVIDVPAVPASPTFSPARSGPSAAAPATLDPSAAPPAAPASMAAFAEARALPAPSQGAAAPAPAPMPAPAPASPLEPMSQPLPTGIAPAAPVKFEPPKESAAPMMEATDKEQPQLASTGAAIAGHGVAGGVLGEPAWPGDQPLAEAGARAAQSGEASLQRQPSGGDAGGWAARGTQAAPQAAPQSQRAPAPTVTFYDPAFDVGTQISQLQSEEMRLRQARRAHRGQSDAPTSEMYAECQELLQMFGIPYIIAPMEAESQCAWMDEKGLVDGVITDDNDVFLFGGQRVYRHIFSANKFVEEFYMKDIERELGMSREKLVLLALLLGSDYTPGISGVGIVNAVEIVNSFPTVADLRIFKEWVESPAEDLLGLLQHSAESRFASHAAFCSAHQGVRKNWDLPDNFPDTAVVEAYSSPRVDEAKDRFIFGRPDLELLRSFCIDCFGWNTEKADELLLPVISSYHARQAQLTMDAFLSQRERFAKIKSKRLQKALGGIKPGLDKEVLFELGDVEEKQEDEGEGGQVPKKAKKQQRKQPQKHSRKTGNEGKGSAGASKRKRKQQQKDE